MNVGQSTGIHIDLQQNGTSTCCYIPTEARGLAGGSSTIQGVMWASQIGSSGQLSSPTGEAGTTVLLWQEQTRANATSAASCMSVNV
jgi:hypothetical protein